MAAKNRSRLLSCDRGTYPTADISPAESPFPASVSPRERTTDPRSLLEREQAKFARLKRVVMNQHSNLISNFAQQQHRAMQEHHRSLRAELQRGLRVRLQVCYALYDFAAYIGGENRAEERKEGRGEGENGRIQGGGTVADDRAQREIQGRVR